MLNYQISKKIGEIAYINLYQNNTLITSISGDDLFRFELLKYNTTYRIEVVYEYDYNDETGIQVAKDTYQIQTKPVFGSPVISINNVIVGVEDVLFELNIEDAKDSGELAKN